MRRSYATYLFSVLVALLITPVFTNALLAGSLLSEDSEKIDSAVAAAGCEIGWSYGADLQRWPGDPKSDLRIVAAMSDQSKVRPDEAGTLCVGVVRSSGAGFAKVALVADKIRPRSAIDPISQIYVSIDKVPFRISLTETAFAVRVTQEFNSTSTNFNSTNLYLFRRQGRVLREIFEAGVGEGIVDKTSDTEKRSEWIIKFSQQIHQGMYDLILTLPHKPGSKSFIWNGSHYEAVPYKGRQKN